MSTLPTPLLKDRTYSSVAVTDLFHGGTTFIQFGKVNQLVADTATFDELTVTNLIVSGVTSGSSSVTEASEFNLSPSQLVATNPSSVPVSFPYGGAAGQIAIRDGSGAASFTTWTTPETAQTQLQLATGGSTFLNIDLSAASGDGTLTLPDVGADANQVIYSSGLLTKNVLSGVHNLHIQSTGGIASVNLGTNTAGSTLSFDLGAGGSTKAKITTDFDAKSLTIYDVADNVRFRITPTGAIASDMQLSGALCPMTTAAWGLSNGNLSTYDSLVMRSQSASSTNFTDDITLNSYITTITLNTGLADSIATETFKDFTFNNTFIQPSSRFKIDINDTGGVFNVATVGAPYVFVKFAGVNTATLRVVNLSETNTLSIALRIVVLVLP